MKNSGPEGQVLPINIKNMVTVHGSEVNCLVILFILLLFFLVPMLQRGNAYHMGPHAGAWEPGNNSFLILTCLNT